MNTRLQPTVRLNLAAEKGIALLSALMILIIIAIIGVAVGVGAKSLQQTVTIQEDQSSALAAAETTLRLAERALWRHVIDGNEAAQPDCTAPAKCFVGDFDANNQWWQIDSNWATVINVGSGDLYSAAGPLFSFNTDLSEMGLLAAPQFRVEVSSDPARMRKLNAEEGADGLRLHQVTVKGHGRGQGEVVIQSVYGVMVEGK